MSKKAPKKRKYVKKSPRWQTLSNIDLPSAASYAPTKSDAPIRLECTNAIVTMPDGGAYDLDRGQLLTLKTLIEASGA